MTVGVVDSFKVVNVEQQNTKWRVISVAAINLLFNDLLGPPAVCDSCQLIGIGQGIQQATQS